MKCRKCNRELGTIGSAKVCPFCGNRLDESQTAMTLSQALSKIMLDYGKDILKAPEKVSAMVLDYAFAYPKDTRMFGIAAENGILALMREARETGDSARRLAILEKSAKKLEEEAFFSPENAQYIVAQIAEGTAVKAKPVSPEPPKPESPRPEPQKKECPFCGKKLSAKAKFCSGCGKALEAEPVKPRKEIIWCPTCQKPYDKDVRFCRKCGTKLIKKPQVYPDDPCPCGSGKKFKQCCGRPAESTSTETKYCPNCREPYNANARFCRKCGAKLITIKNEI